MRILYGYSGRGESSVRGTPGGCAARQHPRALLLLFLVLAACGTAPVLAATATDHALAWKFPVASNFKAVSVSPDALYVAGGTFDGKVHLFSIEGELLRTRDLGEPVEGVAIAAGGDRIAVGSAKGTLSLLSGEGTALWNRTLGDAVYDVAISADGTRIAAGSDDGHVYLFGDDGVLRWRYRTGGTVYGVGLSADGGTVAAGSSNFHVYRLNRNGTLDWRYFTGAQVFDVALSPGGESLAAGGSDRMVYLLDAAGARIMLAEAEEAVNGVAVSSGGSLVAAGSSDYFARIFGPGGITLLKYPTFQNVNSVSLSPGGRYLAVASDDGTISLLASPSLEDPPVSPVPADAPADLSTGSIEVTSDPAGAAVYIDDEPAGFTPVTIAGITEGEHTITLEAPGYASWTQEVVVVTDETVTLDAELSPAPGPTESPAGIAGCLAGLLGCCLLLRRRR
jgi:WD40 repeat protein